MENNTISALYQKNDAVTCQMTDRFGFCRLSDTLRFLQEAAAEQLELCGPDEKTLSEQHRAFFLSRISVELDVPLLRGERVLSETWPCASSRGYAFDRCYRLTKAGENAPAVRAVSQWAMISTDDRRLVRVEDSGFFYSRDEALTVSIPLRFRIPKTAEWIPCGEKKVSYSDADRNGHMNNTHYPDLVCDALPALNETGTPTPIRVTAFAAAFLHEAPIGETLSLFRTELPDENGLYYFRTVRVSDGETNMEAAVRLSDGCEKENL